MANPEHVERLKRSVEEWNAWRQEHPEIQPDLSNANLICADLSNANLVFANLSSTNFNDASLFAANLIFANLSDASLIHADLRGANLTLVHLTRANLINADLSRADLNRANLSNANLSCVYLNDADLSDANLSNANLSGAVLTCANLSGAKLNSTNLSRAYLSSAKLNSTNLSNAYLNGAVLINTDLSGANLDSTSLSSAYLSGANLSGADLSSVTLNGAVFKDANLNQARFAHTVFAWIDLSLVKGLETARHGGPSSVDINSVTLPHDEATRLHFLRGVGFTETQIEYLPSLLTPRPIEYQSLFISYASPDEAIAKRLHTDLRKKDVPCWFAPHDLRPGTLLVRGIEEAIHKQDKLLLILSHHAVTSNWVQYEVEAALHKQATCGRETLFPIRLDNAILESDTLWAKRLCKHHIGDFTNWQDDTVYQQAFTALLRHLKVTRPPTA